MNYYIGKKELTDFVAKERSTHITPSLNLFLRLHTHLFYAHEFTNVDNLQKNWVRRFKRIVPEGDTTVDAGYWRKLFQLNKIEADEFTPGLFQYAYILWTKQPNLQSMHEILTRLANNYFQKNTNTSISFLKRMSYSLLKSNIKSPLKIATIKLALSNIINTMDSDMMQLYTEHIQDEQLWNTWLEVDNLTLLDPSTKEYIQTFADTISEISVFGEDILLLTLCDLRAELQKENSPDNTLQIQLVRIYTYVLDNMIDWQKHQVTTESEHVFRIKGLLKIVFEDLYDIGIVEVKSGETTARATKQSKYSNTFHFAGGYDSKFYQHYPPSITPPQSSSSISPPLLASPPQSSLSLPSTSTSPPLPSSSASSTPTNVMGNRIDLSVYGDYNVELSLSEVKPTTGKTKLESQRSKSLRDNQCIYYNLMELGVTPKYIMGTTWGGMTGQLFQMKYKDGVGVAKLYSNLILPYNMQLILDLKETLLGLYGYKNYNENLNQQVQRALSAPKNTSPTETKMPHSINSPRR